MNAATSDNPGNLKYYILGCAAVLLALFVLSVSAALYFALRSPAVEPPQFIEEARPALEVKASGTEQKERLLQNEKYSYDIDQTVTALFSIEKALRDADGFQSLTSFIMQKDSDLVAPDVERLKCRIFDAYKDVLDSRDGVEEMNSMYRMTMGNLTDLVGVLGADPISIAKFDKEQARQVWRKRIEESKSMEKLKARLSKSEDKFLDLFFEYARLNSKYIKEWDSLCSLRDRAYLAFYEKDWEELDKSAAKAAEMAPHEKEAHILLAVSLIEKGGDTGAAAAKAVVDKLLKEHQGQEAPAYLLRGIIAMKSKDYDAATLDFDQAAAYYPKQQEEVTDRLSLYKKRQFLNSSKEGRVIVNTYRSIMSGSGYFSPDFQKARIHLSKGEASKAKDKIFDHFFRRRLQGQWDRILSDFLFCRNYLETDLYKIIAGDGNIDLVIEPAWITNSIRVTVNNRSAHDIHNVTILLCVRFTDMFKGDYVSFPFGESAAVLPAGGKMDFGKENLNDVTKETLGTVKKSKDIIEYGAVLISDEIITWVPPCPAPLVQDSASAGAGETILDGSQKAKDALKNMMDKLIDSAVKEARPDKK